MVGAEETLDIIDKNIDCEENAVRLRNHREAATMTLENCVVIEVVIVKWCK